MCFHGRSGGLVLPLQQIAHVRRDELSAGASLRYHVENFRNARHAQPSINAEVVVVPPDVEHLRRL
jgi:hypothetical protein